MNEAILLAGLGHVTALWQPKCFNLAQVIKLLWILKKTIKIEKAASSLKRSPFSTEAMNWWRHWSVIKGDLAFPAQTLSAILAIIASWSLGDLNSIAWL